MRYHSIRAYILLILLICPSVFAQLNPLLPPGSNFNLSSWKLQTIDTANKFIEITSADLMAGHTNSLFYTDSTDGSMVFRVPSNGGTTSGSSYPRIELRQTAGGANWALTNSTQHYLTADCKVIKVAAAKPQVIIGQIHGSETNSELLKLRWTGDQPGQCFIEARYQKDDTARTEYGATLASGLSLGDLITYTITMKSGKITCTVNGASASQTYTTTYYGTSDRYYFKAGNYLQYNSTNASIYGQTQFYKLSLTATTSVNEEQALLNGKNFSLSQNYPNPFNPSTTIKYSVPTTGNISLKVSDVIGNEIAVLVHEDKPAGTYEVAFNAGHLTSGIYFYQLQAGSLVQTKKLTVLK